MLYVHKTIWTSGMVPFRHCIIEFIKQVFPKFRRPTNSAEEAPTTPSFCMMDSQIESREETEDCLPKERREVELTVKPESGSTLRDTAGLNDVGLLVLFGKLYS